jgi:hypothetical protein
MADTYTHLDQIHRVKPKIKGCEECPKFVTAKRISACV